METKTLTGEDAAKARAIVPMILAALLDEDGLSLTDHDTLTVGQVLPPIIMEGRLVFRFGPASLSTTRQIALDAFQGRQITLFGLKLRFSGAWPMMQRLATGVRFKWEHSPRCEDYWGILDVRIESVDLYPDRAVTTVTHVLGKRQVEVTWPGK
jgi:hypothetical protein